MRKQFFKRGSALVLLGLLLALTMTASTHGAQPAQDNPLAQFTSQGHVLGFRTGEFFVSNATYALHVEFVAANAVTPQSDTPAETQGNTPAPLSRVTYANLWDGITLAYDAAHGGVVSSSYRIAPHADPRAIRLRYNAPVTLNDDGTLNTAFAAGQIIETTPIAWQEIDGVRVSIPVAFSLPPLPFNTQSVAFAMGEYDASQPLFIDPTLTWNTFLGGSGSDIADSIAVDGNGNVYVGGFSDATWGTPVRAYTSGHDAFAAKLDSRGGLTWNTFLGGSGTDAYGVIAVDGSGNVYVGGRSTATWGTPVRAFTSSGDAFAAKLDSRGALEWNTFLGGGGDDYGWGIAVDGSDNVYVGGWSPATWGTPVRAYTGSVDAFAAKLDSRGGLTWNTFLGGSGFDQGGPIAVDGSGNVYAGGRSDTMWGTPVRRYTSGEDAFAAKLDSDGGLTWNTFLGGNGTDYGNGIAVDGSGSVYVGGRSDATWGTPVRAFTSSGDTFATKLDSRGALAWNTFFGGGGDDWGSAIAVDGSGNVYVGGQTDATWGTPVRAYTSDEDAFAAKLDLSGGLTWNTFLGGSGFESGGAIAIDGSGNVYAAGSSNATWGSPVRAYTSGFDVFVAKIDNSPVCSTKPAKPTLLKPQNNATFSKTIVPLDWSDVACIIQYKVIVKDAVTGHVDFKKTVTVSKTKTTALAHKTYVWYVKACNALSCTKSAKFKFTIP